MRLRGSAAGKVGPCASHPFFGDAKDISRDQFGEGGNLVQISSPYRTFREKCLRCIERFFRRGRVVLPCPLHESEDLLVVLDLKELAIALGFHDPVFTLAASIEHKQRRERKDKALRQKTVDVVTFNKH